MCHLYFTAEKKFLAFFFKRLKLNNSGKYEKDFPFISPCGREKNFVRCDDIPIVFTHILEETEGGEKVDYLSYAHTGDMLTVPFEPEKICMLPESGRVYHPGPEATGGVGLIKSSLAIDLSQKFEYKNKDKTDEMPIYFTWKERKYSLTNEVVERLRLLKNLKV